VATILPFIRARADFDDETTRLMGEAFDAARASLDGQDEPEHGMLSRHADHDVRCLDDNDHIVADLQVKLLNSFICNG
jgi:hypothetical protein